jgi:signal transduction histidine kinase/CHASE1-domain containing sensor protein
MSPVERVSTGSAWAVLVVSLLVSFLVWIWAARQAAESLDASMQAASQDMALAIAARMDTYELVLRGAVALFRAEEGPDRAQWAAYVADLEIASNLPGVQALSYAIRLAPEDRDAHERAVRDEGFEQYSITPEGVRPDMAPVVYIEPFEGSNLRVFGFDMLSDPARREALVEATVSGAYVLTGPIRLLQQSDARNDRGVLLAYPVYRSGMPLRTEDERVAAAQGWIFATVVMRDFLRMALAGDPSKLGATLFDLGPDDARSILFRPAIGDDEVAREAVELKFEVGNRSWLLQLDPAAFGAERDRLGTTPMLVLAFGLVASLLLFTLVWSMATTRDRALAIARDITRQLTAVNNELESRVAARTSLLQRVNERLERQVAKRRSAVRARRAALNRERELNARLQAISEFAAEMTVPEPIDDKLHTLSAAARELLDGAAARVSYASAEDGRVREGGHGREEWWSARPGQGPAGVARLEAPIFDADSIQRGRITVLRREDRPFSREDELVLAHFALLAGAALSVRESFESQLLARRLAEQSSRIKDQLLSVVSHELRTPLSAMKGWVHVLGQVEAREPVDAARRQAVEALGRSVDAQRELIEDLIDTAAVIAGTFELEIADCDLGELMRAAHARAGSAALAKRVALTVEGDSRIGMIEADPVRMAQVLDHLLENAIKFTPEGGSIHMAALADGDTVRVEVVDSGEGIDAESLPHLFERFWTADPSTTRRVGGLGVGLSLVRAIIEAHGGRVQAQSRGRGQGARLVIALPRRAKPQ